MKKVILCITVALALVSCQKMSIQPASAAGNNQKVTGVPRDWTMDFRWKFSHNGVWYSDQEITYFYGLDSTQMAMKADTLRAIDLPDYKVTYVAYW